MMCVTSCIILCCGIGRGGGKGVGTERQGGLGDKGAARVRALVLARARMKRGEGRLGKGAQGRGSM